ncbi:MAG: hypothetical protein JNM72_20770 [Deltaproteobacteria bacterium]|jgi:hypothetical protein|nr:hypothetical protein [Deltaproteobacteria bacterium]
MTPSLIAPEHATPARSAAPPLEPCPPLVEPAASVLVARGPELVDERHARRRWSWRRAMGLPIVWETVTEPVANAPFPCEDEAAARARWARAHAS